MIDVLIDAASTLSHRIEALSTLFSFLSPAARAQHVADVLAQEQAGRLDLSNLLIATIADNSARVSPAIGDAAGHGRVAGAVLGAIQPGRTAMVWPPRTRLAGEEGRHIEDCLLTALTERLDRQGALLSQALVEPADSPAREALARNGFPRLTTLVYLSRSAAETASSGPAGSRRRGGDHASALTWISYSPLRHALFADVVRRTYEGSRDCPQLEGIRPIDDVLAGHRAAGEFDPGYWRVYFGGAGAPVGCLLLALHPIASAVEIVYVGVLPAMRGQGLGERLIDEALHLTRLARAEQLFLAVDAANEPARKLYERKHFRPWDERIVQVRVARSAPLAL